MLIPSTTTLIFQLSMTTPELFGTNLFQFYLDSTSPFLQHQSLSPHPYDFEPDPLQGFNSLHNLTKYWLWCMYPLIPFCIEHHQSDPCMRVLGRNEWKEEKWNSTRFINEVSLAYLMWTRSKDVQSVHRNYKSQIKSVWGGLLREPMQIVDCSHYMRYGLHQWPSKDNKLDMI